MKKIISKILAVTIGTIGLCSNFCYADLIDPASTKINQSIDLGSTIGQTESFNYIPIVIIGIVIAIIVIAAIIVLVKGKKEE